MDSKTQKDGYSALPPENPPYTGYSTGQYAQPGYTQTGAPGYVPSAPPPDYAAYPAYATAPPAYQAAPAYHAQPQYPSPAMGYPVVGPVTYAPPSQQPMLIAPTAVVVGHDEAHELCSHSRRRLRGSLYLSFISFVLAIVAVASSYWYRVKVDTGFGYSTGNVGLWEYCLGGQCTKYLSGAANTRYQHDFQNLGRAGVGFSVMGILLSVFTIGTLFVTLSRGDKRGVRVNRFSMYITGLFLLIAFAIGSSIGKAWLNMASEILGPSYSYESIPSYSLFLGLVSWISMVVGAMNLRRI